jgi:hypothetical protein
MKAFVFPDARLSSYARQVVWLAIDTEKAVNTAVIEKYPVPAWPTLVPHRPAEGIDPAPLDWQRVGRAAHPIPRPGQRAMAGGLTGTAAQLALADKLYADEKYAEAAPAYAATIAARSQGLERPAASGRRDVVLAAAGGSDADLRPGGARPAAPLKGTPSYASAAASGLDCSLRLEKTVPSRTALIALFEKACRESLEAKGLTTDDRSGIYQVLIWARETRRNAPARRRSRPTGSPCSSSRPRTLRRPKRGRRSTPTASGPISRSASRNAAVPMLEQSEKDLPNEYNRRPAWRSPTTR